MRFLFAIALIFLTHGPAGLAAQETSTPSPAPIVEVPAGIDDAPVPVEFPRDDGPHDALIEWWYYTGHLYTDAGDRYGFEFVFFKGDTGNLLGYVSHFAITDNVTGTYQYDQRIAFGELSSQPDSDLAFDLQLGDWRMAGSDGVDRIKASLDGYAIDLQLESTKPPVLHDGDGYVDYGNGQASYYYSRTRIAAEGTLTIGTESQSVSGEAWFDHQWGNFTTFIDGGWDWFSLQLDDQTEIMLYIINDPSGTPVILDGSYVDRDGNLTILDGPDFTTAPTDFWRSDLTGITYPVAWAVTLPALDISLEVTASMPNQELDTRPTTGVIYWEGEVVVEGTRGGEPISGHGYVELTGYADRDPIGTTT